MGREEMAASCAREGLDRIEEKSLHQKDGEGMEHRAVVESPPLEGFNRFVGGAFGDRFSSGLGSAGLMVGLNELRSLFQPEQLCSA